MLRRNMVLSHRLWQLSLGQERCHRCSRYATVAYALVQASGRQREILIDEANVDWSKLI